MAKRRIFDETPDSSPSASSESSHLLDSSDSNSLRNYGKFNVEESLQKEKYQFRPIHFFTSYALIVGIEAQWSLEYSQTNKILLDLNFPQKYLGAIWMIPPILGLLVLPGIGRYSDSLLHPGGRRKPILWSAFLFGMLFLILLGWNLEIASIFTDIKSVQNSIAIALVILSFSMLDVTNKIGEMVNRALHGDVLPPHEVSRGNSIAVWLMGIGSALGYAVSAIKPSFGHENFLVAIVLFVLFAIPTLFYQTDTPLSEEDYFAHKANVQPSLIRSLKSAMENAQIRFLILQSFISWWALNALYMFGNVILSSVLGGSSMAPRASHPYKIFDESVRFAAWGFSGMAIVSLLFGVMNSLYRFRFTLRTFYLLGTIAYVVSTIGLLWLTVTPVAGAVFIALAGFTWGCQQGSTYIWLNRCITPDIRGEMTAVLWIGIAFSQIWASFITFIIQDLLHVEIIWAMILPAIACIYSIIAVFFSKDPALGYAKDFESIDSTSSH